MQPQWEYSVCFAEGNNCRQRNYRESVRQEYILSKSESIQIQDNARKKKLLSGAFPGKKLMKALQTQLMEMGIQSSFTREKNQLVSFFIDKTKHGGRCMLQN